MLPNFLQRALAHPLRLASFATLALALSACGGGGGSPGDTGGPKDPEKPQGPVVASIVLTTNASTVSASGVDDITLTAVAKDAGNNAVSGATISFAATSGTISNTVRVTDASGVVTEKLSVKGDNTPRDITITASSGTITSTPVKVTVVAAPAVKPTVLLTAASGTLNSSGSAPVPVRALVLDVNNAVVKGATVNFTTDTGSLSSSSALSDDNGVATVNVNTASNPTTRVVNVTAKAAGATDTQVTLNVVGTKIVINAAQTVTAGTGVDMTAVLTDSSGSPLVGKQVTFSATRNPVSVKGGGASPAMTDSTGKVVLTYTGTNSGADTVTVSSMGETASTSITTVSTTFSVGVINTVTARALQTFANTNVCHPVLVRDFDGSTARSGTVTVSSSRGAIYSDAACGVPLTSSVALAGGEAVVYIKAGSPGVATLTANSGATGSSVQGVVEFVSPLVSSAVISVQTSPAVIGANAPGSTTEQSVLRAVVLDNATLGNPVKNARVAFSIINDPSGGTLSQPSEVQTASDGTATVSYIAGPTTTATDGVQIEARIISGVSSAAATTRLTVGKRSLFITAGTGAKIETPTSSTYRVDYTVFVTDAAGNPVNDVLVTASVRPRHYLKGRRIFVATWETPRDTYCANEDKDNNGVLSAAEDFNNNGRLDPGTPLNITSNVRTGTNGTAVVSMTYPRDRAYWLGVDFTIRGQVIGSEASYVGYTLLPGFVDDFKEKEITPPGLDSPYGVIASCLTDQ